MALHRLNAKTLGFFPKGAFEEHTKLRQIIVALDTGGNGNCLGYVLYRIARGRASIVHLCVAEVAQGILQFGGPGLSLVLGVAALRGDARSRRLGFAAITLAAAAFPGGILHTTNSFGFTLVA